MVFVGDSSGNHQPANVLVAEIGAATVVKLADFGVSVMARDDTPGGAQRAVSPLVALLTGEVDESAGTESSLTSSDFDDLPTNERNARRDKDAAPAQAAPAGRTRGDDLTEIGAIVGTPMYMAPEISFGSRHAQPAADVFAFGVIAYELVTRELPFKKPPVGSVMRQETLLLPHGLRKRSDLDQALITLFERALNVDPAQRPTAAKLAEALSR